MKSVSSRIAFSTLEVRNHSFRSHVFPKVSSNTNLLNPILHYHHREYIIIMNTLSKIRFPQFSTNIWLENVDLISTTANIAPTILSLDVTSFSNSASLSISQKTKLRASTSHYPSFNEIRNLLQKQVLCKISSMILFLGQFQPNSHTTKHIS